MSASNAFESAVLDLILANVDITGIGDAGGLRGSASAGSLFVTQHTADPGEAGSPITNEVAYTGYARKAVARAAGSWTGTGGGTGSRTNAAAVTFDPCTGGTATVTHFGIVSSASGAGTLLFKGQLTAPLAVSAGISVNFAIGTLTVTAD